MTEGQAREIATRRLQTQWPDRFPALSELSVTPSKYPNRTDWSFTFNQTNLPGFTNQELCVRVFVADGRITDFGASCKAPESWLRKESQRRAPFEIAEMVCKFIRIGSAVAIFILVIIFVSRGAFNWRMACFLAALVAGLSMLNFANGWIAALARFSPIEPYGNQLLTLLLRDAPVVIIMPALMIGFIGGYAASGLPDGRRRSWRDVPAALGWGAALAGLDAGVQFMGPSPEPLWASAGALANYIPWASPILGNAFMFLVATVIVMTIVRLLSSLAWRRWIIGAIILVAGIVNAGDSIERWDYWLFSGIAMGLLLAAAYFQLFRRQPALIPLVMAVPMVTDAIKTAMCKAYPEAALSYAVTAVVILGMAFVLWLLFTRNHPPAKDVNFCK